MNLGDYSRDGKARGIQAVKALDHDMASKSKMIPFGILNLTDNELAITYGHSSKTSDFICDAIEQWWTQVRKRYSSIDELVIYADNGPESSSHRTQFLFRLVTFARLTGLNIHFVYYPPYHSKYNPIERCWAFLEKHWNGTLLNTAKTVIEWTKTMAWRTVHPVVFQLDKHYEKGIRPDKTELAAIQPFISRDQKLAKWDVTISPNPVNF